MPLPTLTPPSALVVPVERLSPASFSAFGTCITCPFPSSLQSVPPEPPSPLHPQHQPQPIFANQNSALKTAPISPLTNEYSELPVHAPSKPLMSMFSCFPRRLSDPSEFPVTILERHPFTTQTFCPLGLSPDDVTTKFLVIVAPSLSAPLLGQSATEEETEIRSPPDLTKVRAFVANGGQAVTYAPGTWHAPMVVLGQKRIDFVVTQFVNGVAEDDCQEVEVGKGVKVDLKGLRLEGIKPRL